MFASRPEYIFAFFALLVGLFLVFFIPPIGVIDENAHVRRASEVSQFIFINPETHSEDKLTLWADNAWVQRKSLHTQGKVWNFSDINNIGTGQPQEKAVAIDKNILSLNSPVVYAPLGLILKFANSIFHPDYVAQFYILRLTALILSVALFAMAIARMPEHKTLLAAIGLLPVMFYNRSGVNIDGLTIGCVALFIVQIHNLCRKDSPITFSDKLSLLLWGFLMAQCKGAYLPLLFLILLIPKRNFSSKNDWLRTAAIVIVPAIFCSMGWAAFAKQEILSGLRYYTDEATEVWPDGQMAWITSHPLSYAAVLLKTVFASPFIPISFMQMLGNIGWNGFSIPAVPTLVLLLLFISVILSEPLAKPLYNSKQRMTLLLISAITSAFMLTMIYVQWTAYQSPTVVGFQGRYFYPLLPILIIFARPTKELAGAKRAAILLWAFGAISSTSIIWETWVGNY